jgi:uridine kinase
VNARSLLAEVAASLLACGEHRLRVGIDGPTAAGKTTFGDELADELRRSGRPVLRATLDDFKKPWRDRHLYDRESGEGYYRNAYDYAAVARLLLEPASPGGSGACALRSIDPLTQVDHSNEITVAAADAVLIVDGVFAFRPELDEHWDYRIWLHVDRETSLRRGAQRDREWAGSEVEALILERYLPSEQLYVHEVDPIRRADAVIDNSCFERPLRSR